MLGAMEEILCELVGDKDMNQQHGLPPGFRFHPTDEELIAFYLASKVLYGRFCGLDIAEVDLNRCEPWELPDAAKMGEREWYFFSLRDRKYPTGLRTNRATCAGYWKATGKDREVYGSEGVVVGMKKTLVFYKGRAPRGEKTKWVMHEYRLDLDFFHRHMNCKEEWVICRIFHKIGEKKNLLLEGQSHHLINVLPPLLEEAAVPPTLMESQTQWEGILLDSLQNPLDLLHHHNNQQESYLKSLLNPVFSNFNLLPLSASVPSSSFASTTYPITTAVTKQCKTEVACFPFNHSSKDNMMIPWAEEASQTTTGNQSEGQAAPPTTSTTTPSWADFMGFPLAMDHQMPVSSAASVAFNRAGFQCF